MKLDIDWRGMVKAVLKAMVPFFVGALGGVIAGCASPFQTPSSKTQTSSVYAFGLPAVVITHDNKQVSDNSGEDKNSAFNEVKR